MTLAALALVAQAWLSPCAIDQVGPARCGTYEVWENRQARGGRRIPINVIVLPATSEPALPDPLVFLQGGPGDAPSFNARFCNGVFGSVRKTRDLVLIDLRGTGKSASVTCPELARLDASGTLDDNLLNAAAVRACRARLEPRADLRLYTTATATDDLDEVLGALGYAQANFYGTSYGTRVAQSLMARHPARIRTMTMKGVVPQSMAMPAPHARAGEEAWQSVVARCARDAACAKVYPSPAADLESILKRLDRLRQQSLACAEWPRGATPPEHRQPVQSSIPTLLLSGEFDPVTPPSGGDEVLRTLSRGRHVVVRNNGHPIGTAGACIGAMIAQLIDAGSVAAVQTACAESVPSVPFALEGPSQ